MSSGYGRFAGMTTGELLFTRFAEDGNGEQRDRLAAAIAETARLRSENERLRKLLRVREACPQIVSGSEMEAVRPEFSSLTADEKVRLFRSLFRGREDVYAVRWEGRNGKTGYSPACIKRGYFVSKVEARANREFLPLTDSVIRDHLSGKLTIGVYPHGRRMLRPSCTLALKWKFQLIWNVRDQDEEAMCGFSSSRQQRHLSLEGWV
jgi:hypothetical protein